MAGNGNGSMKNGGPRGVSVWGASERVVAKRMSEGADPCNSFLRRGGTSLRKKCEKGGGGKKRENGLNKVPVRGGIEKTETKAS